METSTINSASAASVDLPHVSKIILEENSEAEVFSIGSKHDGPNSSKLAVKSNTQSVKKGVREASINSPQ